MNKKHTLAIGMIVKNEEKYLYRCLEALTPLREAVNCQLIIVDTGSTDKTVEIAKEFTDEVYDFDWIDDFSAARNETIKYADAQWYMFIDADEIFVDIQPIIDFFTSGEYKKYNSACHNRLEILSKDEKNVKNSVISRLFLMDSNCVFRGIIHETIPYIIPFNKVIEATSKHYGYNYEAVEDKKAKFDRNVSLLKKSFEKNPNDLRELYHLIRELLFSKKLYEVEKYIDHSKSLLEKNKEDSYRYGIVYCESLYYFYLEAFDKSIEVAKKRLELSKNTIPADADVYFLMAKNYINLDNPQKVIECLEKSLKIYRDTENGLISKETMSTAEILLIEKNFQEMAEKDLILHYGKIENFQKAKELLEKNKENSSFDYYALKYIEKSKDYDYLFKVFLRTKAEEDEKKYNLLILSIENFIKTEVIKSEIQSDEITKVEKIVEDMYIGILQTFADYENDENDGYINIMKLRYFDHMEDIDSAKEIIEVFYDYGQQWKYVYADVLYYSLKYNMDLSCFYNKISISELYLYINEMKNNHSNLSEIIKKYDFHSENDPMEAFWAAEFLRNALFIDLENKEEAEFGDIDLFEKYMKNIIKYGEGIYKKSIIEENQQLLPEHINFCFNMKNAVKAFHNGDLTTCVSLLKNMVRKNATYVKVIKYYSDRVEEKLNEQEKIRTEMMEQGKLIKAQIRNLIAVGQKVAALGVINQLEKITGSDSELDELRALC